MLLFKHGSISSVHCPRLGHVPAPCLEQGVELLCHWSCKQQGERWEIRAGIHGYVILELSSTHSAVCLLLLQMLCHFSHRSSGGVSAV